MLSNRHGRLGGRRVSDLTSERGDAAQRGFSFIELVMVIAVVSILAALAVPHLHRIKMTSQEKVALASVRAIFEAEALHHARLQTFGDLDQLIGQSFIDNSFETGEKSGYLYVITGASSADFELRASPVSYGDTGFKAYFVNGTGVIRYTEDGSSPDANSPVWN